MDIPSPPQGLKFTFQQYRADEDGTDTRYELVDGEQVPLGIDQGIHTAILKYLEQVFDREIARLQYEWIAKRAAVGVQSPRAGCWDTCRIPDGVVLPLEQWRRLRNREAVIELNEPPPILVVEVVSDSTRTVDYRAK